MVDLSFYPTDRDRMILRYVAKYRFLTSMQLRRIIDGSDQQIGRRATKLKNNGYLQRIPVRLRPQNIGGSEPHIFALANRGAEHLADVEDFPGLNINWEKKNNALRSHSHIAHTLMISEVMTRVEQACLAREDVDFIDTDTIRKRAGIVDHKFSVEVTHKGSHHTVTLVPDYLFGLQVRWLPRGENTICYFLEADRSTETQISKSLFGSSIYKKMAGYLEGGRRKILQEITGGSAYNLVWFVTQSRERANRMVATNMHDGLTRGAGSNLFVFSDLISIERSDDVFSLPFINGKKEKRWLLPKKPSQHGTEHRPVNSKGSPPQRHHRRKQSPHGKDYKV